MFSLKRKLTSTQRLGLGMGSLLLILIAYTSSMNYWMMSHVTARYAAQNAMLRQQIARLATECTYDEGWDGQSALRGWPGWTHEQLTGAPRIFTMSGNALMWSLSTETL